MRAIATVHEQLPSGLRVASTGVASAASAGEATRGTTGLALLGTLNTDGAAIKLLTITSSNGGIGSLVARVGDEPKATGTTGLTVTDNDGILDGAEFLKVGTERVGVGTPGKTTDEELNGHG